MDNKSTLLIDLICYYDLLSNDEINYLYEIFKKNRIELNVDLQSDTIFNCFSDFFAEVHLILNNELIQSIIATATNTTIVETVKQTIKFIFSKIKDKKMQKIQTNKVETTKPKIMIDYGKLHILLPTSVSQKKFEYIVDKAFEATHKESIKIEKYGQFSDETQNYAFYSIEEIIKNQNNFT